MFGEKHMNNNKKDNMNKFDTLLTIEINVLLYFPNRISITRYYAEHSTILTV